MVVEQAIALTLPPAASVVPGTPLMMGTTTPSPEEVPPTAKQVVALGHATPLRLLVPEIGWTTLAEAGTTPPKAPADTNNASTPRSRLQGINSTPFSVQRLLQQFLRDEAHFVAARIGSNVPIRQRSAKISASDPSPAADENGH